jgi:hypothetical protein
VNSWVGFLPVRKFQVNFSFKLRSQNLRLIVLEFHTLEVLYFEHSLVEVDKGDEVLCVVEEEFRTAVSIPVVPHVRVFGHVFLLDLITFISQSSPLVVLG